MDGEKSGSAGKERRATEKIDMQDDGSTSDSLIVASSNWTSEKATRETGPLLKVCFKKFFYEFLTQLAWGCLINLRVLKI